MLAVDGSEEMLERAAARVDKLDINRNVEFLQADFLQTSGIEIVESAIIEKRPRYVFFSLGFVCLENGREFSSRIFDASSSGTHFVIMDVL